MAAIGGSGQSVVDWKSTMYFRSSPGRLPSVAISKALYGGACSKKKKNLYIPEPGDRVTQHTGERVVVCHDREIQSLGLSKTRARLNPGRHNDPCR